MNEEAIVKSTAKRLLIEADAKAESLLGIVRMVVAGSIAIALAFALNSPERPESEFLDKQGFFAAIGMTSYFLVGLAAFVLVKTGRYKPWMAWVTASLDVVLIIVNIWLSINFSGLSTHYTLVFPSALMIPLILTFGALRFRPLIQIYMTVIVCLLAMLVIISNPFFETSDSDIIAQMTLTHALPPNLIRIWLLFSTGAVIAIAVWRARGLLYRIAQETEQCLNLTRFLPQTIFEGLNDEAMRELRQGRQVNLTVMFLDIRGFTKMSEAMSPEDTSIFLTKYRSHILDIIDQHGGIVDKFIGDGAVVIFGASGLENDAANASISAAKELMRRFEIWSTERTSSGLSPFEVGIGMNFGDVFLGAIGDDRRVEFTVVGDNVNIASRIEQLTKSEPYKIIATQALIQAAFDEPDADWINAGDRHVRGHEEPITIWGYSGSTTRL